MWNLFFKVDWVLGWLDGLMDVLLNFNLFVFMYVWKEVVLLSQIEGIQVFLIDVLEFEFQILDLDNLQDVVEVVNYIVVVNYGLKCLQFLLIFL